MTHWSFHQEEKSISLSLEHSLFSVFDLENIILNLSNFLSVYLSIDGKLSNIANSNHAVLSSLYEERTHEAKRSYSAEVIQCYLILRQLVISTGCRHGHS